MKLTHQDKSSSLWRRLHAHYTQRLSEMRAMNDGQLDEVMTARTRGRIVEIKALLDLGSDDEVTAQPADSIAEAVSFANQ